jgi:hypothetical protein
MLYEGGEFISEVVCSSVNLPPSSRVLPEKLTGLQLAEFPAFYGTRKFITAFTRARCVAQVFSE